MEVCTTLRERPTNDDNNNNNNEDKSVLSSMFMLTDLTLGLNAVITLCGASKARHHITHISTFPLGSSAKKQGPSLQLFYYLGSMQRH